MEIKTVLQMRWRAFVLVYENSRLDWVGWRTRKSGAGNRPVQGLFAQGLTLPGVSLPVSGIVGATAKSLLVWRIFPMENT